jgi:hypothetical protein
MEVTHMEIKPTYLGTMISLATVAFGFVTAGAWNKFITDLIAVFLRPGTGVWAELLYAVIVTTVTIVFVQFLGKIAQADIGPKTVIGEKLEEKKG